MTKLIVSVALAALVLTVGAASATASTTITCDPSCSVPFQEWIDGALVPTPPNPVSVLEEPCDPEPACTSLGGPIRFGTSVIFSTAEHPWALARGMFLHEVGHHFDYQVMTDGDRDYFRGLIGDSRPWRADGGNSPHEVFAEAWRACAQYRTRPPAQIGGWGYGFNPPPERFRTICRFIRNAYWY